MYVKIIRDKNSKKIVVEYLFYYVLIIINIVEMSIIDNDKPCKFSIILYNNDCLLADSANLIIAHLYPCIISFVNSTFVYSYAGKWTTSRLSVCIQKNNHSFALFENKNRVQRKLNWANSYSPAKFWI